MTTETLLRRAGIEPPRQARSRRSYNRIIEATVELLGDRSFDDISVDEIVDRAGYTKGAFYHRFDSKATLLRHLLARQTEGAVAAWDEFLDPASWRGASLGEILEAYVHRLVAIYSRSTHLMRVFAWEARWGGDDLIRENARSLNDHVVRRFVALVETRRDELAAAVRDDPEAAVRFWVTTLASTLQSLYLWPGTGMADESDPEAVEARLSRLLVPYLT